MHRSGVHSCGGTRRDQKAEHCRDDGEAFHFSCFLSRARKGHAECLLGRLRHALTVNGFSAADVVPRLSAACGGPGCWSDVVMLEPELQTEMRVGTVER